MSAAGGSTATLTDAPRWDPGTDALLEVRDLAVYDELLEVV